MDALILQHTASEGPGLVLPELTRRGWRTEVCELWRGGLPPARHDFKFVLVLGGPMNIYQHRDFPWLVAEKKWLSETLEKGVAVFGICLGAQLLADVLGARVVQNPEYEVGWWPVEFTDGARSCFAGLPERATFMHWHGDTFALPEGAIPLASTLACPNQGFLWNNRVLGLQFHPEVDENLAAAFAVDEGGNWPSGRFVQDPERLRADALARLPDSAATLGSFLDFLLPVSE